MNSCQQGRFLSDLHRRSYFVPFVERGTMQVPKVLSNPRFLRYGASVRKTLGEDLDQKTGCLEQKFASRSEERCAVFV